MSSLSVRFPALLPVRRLPAALFTVLLAAQLSPGAEVGAGKFHGRPSLVLSNDRIELQILELGGAFASLTLKESRNPVNPMWDSIAQDQAAGRKGRAAGSLGHFLCVDGFGPVSEEERAAGLPGHGEAHTLPWVVLNRQAGRSAHLTQSVQLPLTQEVYTRTLRLTDGENVISVEAELESLVGFDRPVNWAEHATIGPPFLTPGDTVVDIAPSQSMTRPHRPGTPRIPHRLVSGKEFEWPNAPVLTGGTADLRAMPLNPNSLDHTAHRFDPSRPHAWVTALHRPSGLLLGYIFPREDFPWLQTWENYPPDVAQSARGLEFGTQAFDLPRREVVTENRLMGELLYRWLPAKSKIKARYWMFWTEAPVNFGGVRSMEIRQGQLIVTGRNSGTLTLKCSGCFQGN